MNSNILEDSRLCYSLLHILSLKILSLSSANILVLEVSTSYYECGAWFNVWQHLKPLSSLWYYYEQELSIG